jgi:hypothetical protein
MFAKHLLLLLCLWPSLVWANYDTPVTANEILTDIRNFDGTLSSTDKTVQHALNTLDELTAVDVDAWSITNNQTLLTGNKSGSFKLSSLPIDSFSAVWYRTNTTWGGNNTSQASITRGTSFSFPTSTAGTSRATYIGRTSTFGSIYIDFSTVAVGATTKLEYWNGSTWVDYTASITDGTSNFTTDGAIAFAIPGDWATSASGDGGVPAGGYDATPRYWVRLGSSVLVTTSPTAYTVVARDDSNLHEFYGNAGDTYPNFAITPEGQVQLNNLVAQPGTSINVGSAIVSTSSYTSSQYLSTTSSLGFLLSESSSASATTPVRFSPSLRFRSQVWNTTPTAASNYSEWNFEDIPVSGASPTANLTLSWGLGASSSPARTNKFLFNSAGLFSAGTMRIGNGVISDTSGAISFGDENITATGVSYLGDAGGGQYCMTIGSVGIAYTGLGHGIIDAGDLFLRDNNAAIWFGDTAGIGTAPYWYIQHTLPNLSIKSNNVTATTILLGDAITITAANGNISTPGTLGAGATTVSSLTVTGDLTLNGNMIPQGDLNLGGYGITTINQAGGDYDFVVESDTDANFFFLDATGAGHLGLGVNTAPTALLHLGAGTATAGTAPLKFTSGPVLSAKEPGAWGFLTDRLYFTITTGSAEKEVVLAGNALPIGTQILFTDTDIGIYSQANTFLDLFADGAIRIGDSKTGAPTNYVNISGTGNQTFVGSAGFYPRLLSQADEPAAGTGATQLDTSEMCFWIDSDDSSLRLCFNQAGTVKTVALT